MPILPLQMLMPVLLLQVLLLVLLLQVWNSQERSYFEETLGTLVDTLTSIESHTDCLSH